MEKMKVHVDFKSKKGKRPPDSVDISKSVLVCNVFIFLFSAAKASLVPFLTLYFRYLNFSAGQTGIIMGSKTFSALFMAPLWARCAGKRNKRKFILMFSIFMLAAVYLSLTLVPQISTGQDFSDCSPSHRTTNVTGGKTDLASQNGQVDSHDTDNDTGETAEMSSKDKMTFPQNISHTEKANNENSPTASTTVTKITTEVPGSAMFTLPPSVLDSVVRSLEKLGISALDFAKMTPKKIRQLAKSIPEGQELSSILSVLNPKEIKLLVQLVEKQLNSVHKRRERDLRDTWSEIKTKVTELTDTLKEKVLELRQQLFLTVLAILVVGELFCSPVEKVADDAWYDFLDEIDDLEKYGRQRLLTSFAFIIFPIITTLLVDFTPCHLGGHIHHLSIHFYTFGGCLGLTFVVALFYPMPTSGKQKYVSKVIKGCRVLCCNGRNFVYIITLLIMGLIYSTSNYLFWVVQDLGGKELPMGLAVAVAAFSELPMLIFSDKLVKKLSNCGMIALSLLFLSARQLYYSFLWMNWAVVPIELLHSFTHTAMWWAMLSNPEFSVSTPVNRSIRSVLSSLYFGVGYGVGSIISGFVYDEFGSAILFRGAAIIAGSWMLVFLIINKCIPPKNRVRYAKLLQNEEEMSDDSNTFEDDWLEQALKEH